MDPRFDDIAADPRNCLFSIVFFPDRVYHAAYLNATRSNRYRYYVDEVRGKADISVIKGEVFLDGIKISNILRIEYRGARLSEVAREANRFLGDTVVANVAILGDGDSRVQTRAAMHYDSWIDAYQVEFWETLEPPPGKRHDYTVLDMIGSGGSITRVPQFADTLKDPGKLQRLELAFRENDWDEPSGPLIPDNTSAWDNYFRRNVQIPNTQDPSSDRNTVDRWSYGIDFQRGWFVKRVRDILPVRYLNRLMEPSDPRCVDDNIIEMRWVLQREFGGTIVFFREVTIPPHAIEGTHQHIGSEELYYIIEGSGIAYMGAKDDPNVAADTTIPTEIRPIYGLDPRPCKKLTVSPGSVIFTKSGGIHGIENPNDQPLRFVAFLYHST
jgi:mannose-6-phosphate isomerase-like protein (cupin superfamily)